MPENNDVIHIEIVGEVRGKGRPRFARATGHTYTPPETTRYEAIIKHSAGVVMAGRPPLEVAVNVRVDVHVPIAASWSQKKQRAALAGEILPTGKIDIDNYIKIAFDALNGIVFRDDSQIVGVAATKRYSDRPRMEIRVQPAPPATVDHKSGEIHEAELPLLLGASP